MKFEIPFLRAWWGAKNQKNTQSLNVVGDNNTVEQNISVYISAPENRPQEKNLADLSFVSSSITQSEIETAEDYETQEIKTILDYRRIASEGDRAPALKLLQQLKKDERYQSGYVAFRLNFSIGLIFQSIGNYESASASLRSAYAFYPDHPKAQAGLAFADLLDEENRKALDRATQLLRIAGDHIDMCAVVALHAATNLRQQFTIQDFDSCDATNADVVIANLEHLRILKPGEYPVALRDALEAAPDSHRLKSIWANMVLDDVRRNQAFLLGAKMPDDFEKNLTECASILQSELKQALKQNPPNSRLLPSQINNAAVALRLVGETSEAARLLDRALEDYPDLIDKLAQVRAALFLQQNKDADAFKLAARQASDPELQIMAAEIEAKMLHHSKAIDRINAAIELSMPDELRLRALTVKAGIGINSSNRAATEEAIDELSAGFSGTPELMLMRSAYNRVFEPQIAGVDDRKQINAVVSPSPRDLELLNSLKNVSNWEFSHILQAADELLASGMHRKCAELLRERVSFARESPALQTLCDACIRGGMGALAKKIIESLSDGVRNSVFGWKFGANVGYLSGEIAKAVPLTRKLFEENQYSLDALQWHVQSLLRINEKNRVCRLVKSLSDKDLIGTVSEKCEYTKLLMFCGEITRARQYAYRIFCENQNDHRAWMALSSSVLALGNRFDERDPLKLLEVGEHAVVEIVTPNGAQRKYILEGDAELFPLRQENIKLNHPIARAVLGRKEGDTFEWPLEPAGGIATIKRVKHKALEAFHFAIQRYEEKFPDANGFKSIKCDPSSEDGLEEIKALLRQRALDGQQKALEHHEGSYPLSILGFRLGLDPIDVYLGLNREFGFPVQVSSCTLPEQNQAAVALKSARKTGVLLDAVAVYLLKRLELVDIVEKEFGKIGVTQNTIDVFASRLRRAETPGGFDDNGRKRSNQMSFRDGRIVITEMSEDDIDANINLLQSDLDWLTTSCELVPSAAKVDPPDSILEFRNEKGGGFLDDLFACDGSDRVLVSDDYYLRQWGDGLFKIQSAWIQALLFHLEKAQRISAKKVVSATVQLLDVGEDALSINVFRLLTGAEMWANDELEAEDYKTLCSVVGQSGADIASHVGIALGTIEGLWSTGSLNGVKQFATSLILRNLVRNQGPNSKAILDKVQECAPYEAVYEYIEGWRTGHFL